MTGYAFATAFAAPVDDGMILAEAARPARQSAPFMEPSTVSCEAVAIVVDEEFNCAVHWEPLVLQGRRLAESALVRISRDVPP